MAEKPRTAADVVLRVANQLHAAGPPTSPKAIARMSAAEKTLESWRRELLADGWTYLPGEMPYALVFVEMALEYFSGHRTVAPGYCEDGVWYDVRGSNVRTYGARVYAHRPMPEPPEVPEL